MCGIAGVLKFNHPTTPQETAAVERMMSAQAHRGPDGAGLYRDNHVVLGHRRLKVLDLSELGCQPMANRQGTIRITYNGEIYNYQELREELVRHGWRFRSKTDTEVLLYGYEEWGIEGLLSRLRGMFAFGIYDATSSEPCLILARDRFGIKPLYYYQDRERIIFASEVKAIAGSGLVRVEMNLDALILYLQLGSIATPQTAIKGILALPAGHYFVSDQRDSGLRQYWDLSACVRRSFEDSVNVDDSIKWTRGLLEESVRLHLASDVPLGIFLSGGIDSSALVALASGLQRSPLTTVSVVFDEAAYSEERYAESVATRYKTDHHKVLVRNKDFMEELPRIFASMDQPTVDGVNTYFVSKAARQAALTVVLSGLGGDEVFLGYDHFRKARVLEQTLGFLHFLPGWIRRGLISTVVHGASVTRKHGLEKISYLEEPSTQNAYLLMRGLFAPRQIQDLLEIDYKELSLMHQPRNLPNHSSLLDSLVLFEFSHYLQNQLLKDTDFMSMAHALEIRVPYLDHLLVEYVLGLPARLKLANGMSKRLLVKALGQNLPKEVWNRPKRGFVFPFQSWIKENTKELEARSLGQRFLKPRAVEDVWKRFRDGRLHWSRPWALTVLSAWSERCLESPA